MISQAVKCNIVFPYLS